MYKTIDLFAGAGGLSLGFQQTGKFEIVAAAEINKNAQCTFTKNISKNYAKFEFIDNVIGCNFEKLANKFDGIDIVIGGPPCQGFSNANRQKNHLISMNNSLVKEYFRAIKEIEPKMFVMENVSMLRSNVHRFYESKIDNKEIDELIKKGFDIIKREDKIVISNLFCEFDILKITSSKEVVKYNMLPEKLYQLLKILKKNLDSKFKLDKYVLKQSKMLLFQINEYVNRVQAANDVQRIIIMKLEAIRKSFENSKYEDVKEDVTYIIEVQKALQITMEIYENELMGEFTKCENGKFVYEVKSYSIIDYINAILGDNYVQSGETLNASWFGVPQERKRYIIVGIRKDIVKEKDVFTMSKPAENIIVTVGEAIQDLSEYAVGHKKDYNEIVYNEATGLCKYAQLMRRDSKSVKNHITTNTTTTALERFKLIKQGKNFHSLTDDFKTTYSKPERTQNTIYLRLDSSKPCGTVVNVRKSMWIHPDLNRAITVREAARLQSFPDWFEFAGTKDSQYQQVGNAVPPLMAKAIAEKVLMHIE